MASIVKLPSGNWRALIRKRGSKALSETFSKKRDAEQWAKAQELKIDSIRRTGRAETPAGSTFPDFVNKYIEDVGSVKPFGKNKSACLRRLSKEFDGVLMSDMTELRISQFTDRRAKDKNRDGDPISGVTISVDLSYISTILAWAKHAKLYDVDAEASKKVRGGLTHRGFNTRSKEREREPTKEELEKIMAEYERRGSRQIIPMIDIIRFALHSAMRQEEICSLQIKDLNKKEKTVIIRDRKHPTEKIGNDQVVPLLGEAWNLAERYTGDRKDGRIFSFNHRSVSSSFTRVCKECGIEDLHFHDLRHAAIGMLFELGLTIEKVALVSGHKDWKMLQRYTHIKPEHVHASFDKRKDKDRRKNREELIDYLDEAVSD